MPPSTTLPVAGSWATCPLKKRKPSILTAWENGPTGGASSGEVIAVLLITAPVATSVARQSTLGNAGWARPAPQIAIACSMVQGTAPGAMGTLVRPLTDQVAQAENSCFAKGTHRAHSCRAPGWKIAGENGNGEHKWRHDQEHSRIMGPHPIEHTCHHGRRGCRNDQSGGDAHASK